MQAIDAYLSAFRVCAGEYAPKFPEFHICPVSEHPDPRDDMRMTFTVWQRGRFIGQAIGTKSGDMRYAFTLPA